MGRTFESVRIRAREFLNPLLGPFRRMRIKGHYPFTVISDNCWGGHFYRYFHLPYDSPTIGLYFFASDYIKFIYHLDDYINNCSLEFISLEVCVKTLKKMVRSLLRVGI